MGLRCAACRQEEHRFLGVSVGKRQQWSPHDARCWSLVEVVAWEASAGASEQTLAGWNCAGVPQGSDCSLPLERVRGWRQVSCSLGSQLSQAKCYQEPRAAHWLFH